MQRDLDTEAAIIANDMDSMARRIEMLQAHPGYTSAAEKIRQARALLNAAREALHKDNMDRRVAAGTADRGWS